MAGMTNSRFSNSLLFGEKFSDEQAAAVCTIENIQRQDLNPIEEANAYAVLVKEFSYHHEEVGRSSKNAHTISIF